MTYVCFLLKVDDDLETRYLRAQKAELSFSLDVPGKVGCTWHLSWQCT